MDNASFSEIVIENSTGEMRQIVANAEMAEEPLVEPETAASTTGPAASTAVAASAAGAGTNFTIEDFDTLDPVPAKAQVVAASVQPSTYMWVVYAVCALLLLVEFLRLNFGGSKTQNEDVEIQQESEDLLLG